MSKPTLPPDADMLDALELVSSGQWTKQDYADWDATRPGVSGKPVKPKVRFQVSQKGAVSIYGLNRMPVTLYANQWRKVEELLPSLKEFMEANADKLASKGEDAEAA